MLSERSYMRDSGYGHRSTSVLTWLICAIAATFILQHVFWRWFGLRLDLLFELSIPAVKSGQVWTFITYGFLHSPANFFHILGNLLGLFFLGRELLPHLGSRRFLGLFFGAVAAGGLLWTATNWSHGGAVIGASAGVIALLVVFACMNPNQPITLLLFFVLPVTLKPKWIAISVLVIDLCGFLFYEAMGGISPMGFAHSAHLGGMAVGWLFYRYVHEREWQNPDRSTAVELPRWFQRKRQAATPPPAYKVNVEPQPVTRADIRAEVDRILDKINSDGFGSLTPAEKRLLDDAKDALSRH